MTNKSLDEILIVDSNPEGMARTAYAISTLGNALHQYTPREFRQWGEARVYLESGAVPRVIVTDFKTDDSECLDVVRHVAQQYPKIPVVVSSSESDPRQLHAALEAGALSHVAKNRLTYHEELKERLRFAIELGKGLRGEFRYKDGDHVLTYRVTPYRMGAIKEVYKAIDENGVPYALKIFKPVHKVHGKRSLDIVGRVGGKLQIKQRQEVETLEKLKLLNSKHIARLVLHGIMPVAGISVPYFVEEFIDGKTQHECLTEARRADRPIRVTRTLRTFIDVAKALTCMHRRGIAHLDVKGDNIIVTVKPDNRVVLTDMGNARSTYDSRPYLEIERGNVLYNAPEQLRGKRGVVASDLWALGVNLYEALTNTHPFTELIDWSHMSAPERQQIEARLIEQTMTRERIPPSDVNPQLITALGRKAKKLDDLVLSMLDRRSRERPPASTVCKKLRAILYSH